MFEGTTEIIFNSNYPIYLLVYLLIPILMFYKVKLYNFNDDFLSKSNTDILKGLFILIIIFHHIGQRMPMPGLMLPFGTFGYLGVSIFFFLSGYGLSVSRLRNNDYCKDFFSKRISRVFVPYMIINLLTLSVNYFFYNINYNNIDIILYTLGIKMIDGTMWYINATIFLYIAFYIAFRYFTGKSSMVVLFSYSVIYWVICVSLHFGGYWYNTIFCFPIGAYIGHNYQILVEHISKIAQTRYLVLMFGITIMFFCLYIIANTRLGSIYHIGVICNHASSIVFVFFIMSFLLKMQFTSNVMGLLGGISFEMYLVHMKVLNIYFKTFNGDNICIYIFLVLVTSILLKGIVKVIQKIEFPLVKTIYSLKPR